MKKRMMATAAALLMVLTLLLTGCSSYQAGTTENGIYRNEAAGFQITTPEDYICYDSDSFNECSHYTVCWSHAVRRGTDKTWMCEYAAKSLGCEALVCSEENTENLTLDEYAQAMADEYTFELFDLTTQSIEEVRIGGKIFKKVALSSSAFESNLYIRQADDRFVYIYYVIIHHEWVEGQQENFFDHVSGIA